MITAVQSPLSERTIESPLGPLRLLARDEKLVGVFFREHKNLWPFARTAPGVESGGDARAQALASARPGHVLGHAAEELAAFFAGDLRTFSTPLAFEVGTPFLHEVWRALLRIPFAARATYGELARALGRPSASRAVGAAVGRNPLSLFVPCHRVVGGQGQLTGFAGGLPVKAWLLRHEDALVAQDASARS